MRSRIEHEQADKVHRSGTAESLSVPAASGESNLTKSGTDVGKTVPPARLLNLRAAGTYLGVSYWTMRALVFGGLIPSVKIPCPRSNDGRTIRRLLIDRHDLDEFIEKNKELEQ